MLNGVVVDDCARVGIGSVGGGGCSCVVLALDDKNTVDSSCGTVAFRGRIDVLLLIVVVVVVDDKDNEDSRKFLMMLPLLLL